MNQYEIQTAETVKQGRNGFIVSAPDLMSAAQEYTKKTKKCLPDVREIISVHQVKIVEPGKYVRLGIKKVEAQQ